MKNTYLLLFCLFNVLFLNANDIKRESSNSDLDFHSFLSGVNVAMIELSPAFQQQVDEGNNAIINQLTQYLQQLGINSVAVTTSQKEHVFNSVSSFCDIVRVKLGMQPTENSFNNPSLQFMSCLGDVFTFSAPNVAIAKGNTTLQELQNVWLSMYNQRVTYQEHQSLSLEEGKMTRYNEAGLGHHLERSTDPIEGKYEKKLGKHANKSAYRIAVIKNKVGGYDVVYLSGATNYKDWEEGELMGQINPKGDDIHHTATWKKPNKILKKNAFVSLNRNMMLILNFKDSKENYEYFKIKSNEIATSSSNLVSASGTAFAVSQSGYFLTSYHLIKKAAKVDVELNGRKYNAVVVKEDVTNDLAILKVEDARFNGLGEIPYTLKTETSEVGEFVFTLGYPLSSTMGKEVKLVDGIISALSGYKGNLATYQVGMPIYGGNSGGALFDKNGALIGIIKARHNDTETTSYAIKARNAMNLIDILGTEVGLPKENKLAGLPLTEQTKIIKNFIFQVNVYK
ncbi:MAG: S1C family serine protease [Chitinophagales bacterium]